MTSILQHAKAELRRAGLYDEDADYDGEIAVQVEALVQTFTAYGHSGGSAERTLDVFNRVVERKPLTALTGEDDEWNDMTEYGPEPAFQNKRCPAVFKNAHGEAFILIDGTSNREYIKFPYQVL